MQIPYIPQDAPFTEDQRSWLAGFLAGLHSRLVINDSVGAGSSGGAAKPVLHILYGTQTGNAETIARDAADAAKVQGLVPVVRGLDELEVSELPGLTRLLLVTSTYGEGEMPDNAELFWDELSSDDAPTLEGVHFGVLALGDTGYDEFCHAGKLFDARFAELGATRIADRVDCDVDFEDAAAAWIESAIPVTASIAGSGDEAPQPSAGGQAAKKPKSPWNRKTPYPARLAVNRLLSGEKSSKEIRHYEFDLGDSGIDYQAGDALGVVPVNDPELVSKLVERLNLQPDTVLPGQSVGVTDLLSHSLEISTPGKDLITGIEAIAQDADLSRILSDGDKDQLDAWLWGKDVLDLLTLRDDFELDPVQVISWLRPLQHRAYSISSSPLEADGHVHLTVASVRYRSGGRNRGGVCSTYLADRVGIDENAGVFLSANSSFRVPKDDDAPMIMVGPGTGVAPFRAFLQERRARGATGPNWLFFGDQHRESDYIYQDEIENMKSEGTLSRLDLAFSRDQKEKIYVQTRMVEEGKNLYAWLEEGGYFYVCGDATRMAKDVEQALQDIVAVHGGLSEDAASDYIAKLKKEKRYLRDVY